MLITLNVEKLLGALYPGSKNHRSRESARILIALCGLVYLAWWFYVELFLPGSFNPFLSRFAVTLFCGALLGLSFVSPWLSRHLQFAFSACLWIASLHYYYLFHFNHVQANWVIGSYILVVAVCTCLQSEFEILSYSAWVLFLSLLLTLANRAIISPVFFPGMISVLVFAFFGVRTRIKLLAESRQNSLWFEKLFDAVFEGIVVHQDSLVIDSNGAFAKIFGYEHGEVVGMHVKDFVVKEEREIVLAKVGSMSEEPYEVTGLRKDGSLVPIEIRGKKHVVGDRVFRLTAVADITARKKNEQDRIFVEASQRSVQMRDEFLSIASHELKTPLTNIKIQTQMAMRSIQKGDPQLFEPQKIRQFIEKTDRQADRLTRLVEEMLDVSRISSGRLAVEWEHFDLTLLAKQVTDAFEAALKQSGSTLVFDSSTPCLICGDRSRLEQVLSNLLSNALKYGNGKPIELRIEQSPTETRLIVADQGIGISPENQDRIFHRFERAISSRKISGLGLGLYISKYIVEAHQGKITLTSQAGGGSSFVVTLPQVEEKARLEGTV